MSLPQRITTGTDICQLAAKWKINQRLATMLVILTDLLSREPRARALLGGPPHVTMISGYRTMQQQRDLCMEVGARPCAAPETSTHTQCPATGADLRIPGATPEVWEIAGEIWENLGGRWGGRFSVPDWNHFDMGTVKPK